MTVLRSVSVVLPDGTEYRGPGSLGIQAMLEAAKWVAAKPKAPWMRTRPSTAKLRRELWDKSTPRERKMQIWNFLQYRRKAVK